MNYDKAYVIGSKEISKKRLDKFFKRKILKDKKIQVWPAINGMDVDIKKYQDLNYLSHNLFQMVNKHISILYHNLNVQLLIILNHSHLINI